MSNGLQMVPKRNKRSAASNSHGSNKSHLGSIRRYCTERKINKKKNRYGKIRINENLRNKKIQNSILSPPNILKSKCNKSKKSILNVQNDDALYEIKPLSPTKLSISVKKFYNNNNFKQYEENLHSFNNKKLHTKRRTTVKKNKNEEDCKHLSKDLEQNGILHNKEQTYCRTKKKIKNVNYQKPCDLIPQLNKELCKKKKNYNNSKSVEVFQKKCNFINDELQIENENETQTNEYLVEEYQVTQSINNVLSISVKRFYKSKIPLNASDNERVNKDMPLVSDTTFNSKADISHSPISSKLNSNHKISLNVKHINDSTNNKQQKVTAFFPIRRSARKTKNVVNEEKQVALEKAILSQNEDGLKIAVFPNKGRGVVANRDFTRGEYVVEYAGELISLQEARKREAIYSQDTTTGCYMYYFKYGLIHYCIDATAESSRLGRLVNHSRFGNLGPKIVEISGTPRIVLVSKIDIKQGEELTYDYGDRSKESLVNHPWLAY